MKLAFTFCLLPILACIFPEAEATMGDDRNIVIAHRGAWKADGLPQNSIASLKRAIELGCYGSEFDVHLTADDVLVLCHDKDHQGVDIATATYAELLAIKLPNGESIPTAEACLREGMKQNETKLVFELKPSALGKARSVEAADLTVDLVKRLGAQAQVEYILFDYDAAKRIIELDPEAKVSYLNGEVPPAQAHADGFYGLDYHMNVFRKHPEWVEEAKNLGLVLNVWTVNSEDDMREFIDMGMDVITTDEPERLQRLLREQ